MKSEYLSNNKAEHITGCDNSIPRSSERSMHQNRSISLNNQIQ